MGDRCHLHVRVLKKDAARLAYAIDSDEFPNDDEWAAMVEEGSAPDMRNSACDCYDEHDEYIEADFSEVDYGSFDAIEQAGNAGLVFTVQQYTGDEYGPGLWASCGDGSPCFIYTDHEHNVAAHVRQDGSVDDTSLLHAQRFWEAWNAAEKLMSIAGSEEAP